MYTNDILMDIRTMWTIARRQFRQVDDRHPKSSSRSSDEGELIRSPFLTVDVRL